MPTPHRLSGIANGAIDTQEHEIKFDISTGDGKQIAFVSKYGPACQLAASLGRMIFELRKILDNQKKMETIAAEKVVEVSIQKDKWSDIVLLQLMTENGIPYAFALPLQSATDIADRLKTESSKKAHVGNA